MLKDATNRQETTMDYSRDFEIENAAKTTGPAELETDPHKLQQRQKQIDFGKNTLGYASYAAKVPRSRREKDQPRTPDKERVCSKRAFEGLLKVWRRRLHQWDPIGDEVDTPQPVPIVITSPRTSPSLASRPRAAASAGLCEEDTRAQQSSGFDDKTPRRLSMSKDTGRQSSVGDKRSHADSNEAPTSSGGFRGDAQGTAAKAARMQTAAPSVTLADFPRLPPLRPSRLTEDADASDGTDQEAADPEPAFGRDASDDGLVWRVDDIPDDPEDEYEIDNSWDEDDVGL